MNKKRYAGIIIIIIAVLLLCLFFIKVPFDTLPDNVSGLVCVNNELKLKSSGDSVLDYTSSYMADLTSSMYPVYCSALANGDMGVTSQIKCINDKPVVVCRTQLYKAILMGKIKFIGSESKNSSKNKEESISTTDNPPIPQAKTCPTMINESYQVSEYRYYLDDVLLEQSPTMTYKDVVPTGMYAMTGVDFEVYNPYDFDINISISYKTKSISLGDGVGFISAIVPAKQIISFHSEHSNGGPVSEPDLQIIEPEIIKKYERVTKQREVVVDVPC